MPEPMWIYLMALLYFSRIVTWSTISEAFDSVSHDRLTRMLNGTWSGHTLLDLALCVLFTVVGGYLVVTASKNRYALAADVSKAFKFLFGENEFQL